MKIEELKIGDLVTRKNWMDHWYEVKKIEMSNPPIVYLYARGSSYGNTYSKGEWVRSGWVVRGKSNYRRIVL
jgi:hypothetical protein